MKGKYTTIEGTVYEIVSDPYQGYVSDCDGYYPVDTKIMLREVPEDNIIHVCIGTIRWMFETTNEAYQHLGYEVEEACKLDAEWLETYGASYEPSTRVQGELKRLALARGIDISDKSPQEIAREIWGQPN